MAGTRVHYIEAGKGDPLILIHGSLCDYRYWRWQITELAQHFRVVAPSLPGCWPEPLDALEVQAPTQTPHSSRYGMARHVDAVVGLCRHLVGEGPAHMLGHSRGAQVALEAALAMPERRGGLILADPGFPFSGEAATTPVHMEIAGRLGTAPLDTVIGEFVDSVNGAGTWRRTVSWFKEMVRANAWTLVPQVHDIHRTINAADLDEQLNRAVLLVGGELSPPRYGSRIDVLQTSLSNAQRITVPRAAHGMNLANAPYFNDAVLRFLLDDPAGSSGAV